MLLKKYSDFGGGKMLNSGKKIRARRDIKNYSNSCCPKKDFWTKKTKHNPPCKLNGLSLFTWFIPNHIIS